MPCNTILASSTILALGLFAAPAHADRAPTGPILQTSAAKNVTLAVASPVTTTAVPAAGADTLIFTAPPRETPEAGQALYQPIAEYLSKATGRRIVYQHPGTWGVYRTQMLKGAYDIIFDGPHFNSYRAEKLNHNIVAKVPGNREFVVIAPKNSPYADARQMYGRTFCAMAPPNLGTLVLLSQFDNPSRQPVILNVEGWNHIYEGVASGRCTGGVLPLPNLKALDKEGRMRIVFKTQALPDQAFSVGPRVSPEDQARIATALVSPEANAPTAKLRSAFKAGNSFAPTSNAEYAGLATYLRSEWGYY